MTTKSTTKVLPAGRQGRQGDIFIEPVGSVPAGTTEVAREQGAAVIAYGESHGHRHQVARGAKLFARGATRFLEVSAKGGALMAVTDDRGKALAEERHHGIVLPSGPHKVTQQIEWTAADEARQVQD